MIEADGIRCSQLESSMLTPFPLSDAILDAAQMLGRPQLFVCVPQRPSERGELPERRDLGHYAVSRKWNRVIELLR